MIIEDWNINCRQTTDYQDSNRTTPFKVVNCTFNYRDTNEDKDILDSLFVKAQQLAHVVNPGAANDSTRQRSSERILTNALAGVISEYCWRTYLNSRTPNLVKETVFSDAACQIDLKTVRTNKTIEVRSSFPRRGIEFAVCHRNYEFDVIGPYSNAYKPDEPQKDFYVRTLFHLPNPLHLLETFKSNGFIAHLTGGATWHMMGDPNFSLNKSLIPEDQLGLIQAHTSYRVVPFSKALDCDGMYEQIAII